MYLVLREANSNCAWTLFLQAWHSPSFASCLPSAYQDAFQSVALVKEGLCEFILATFGQFLSGLWAGVGSLKKHEDACAANHFLGGVIVPRILRIDLFVLLLSALRWKCKVFDCFACFQEFHMHVFDILLHK